MVPGDLSKPFSQRMIQRDKQPNRRAIDMFQRKFLYNCNHLQEYSQRRTENYIEIFMQRVHY